MRRRRVFELLYEHVKMGYVTESSEWILWSAEYIRRSYDMRTKKIKKRESYVGWIGAWGVGSGEFIKSAKHKKDKERERADRQTVVL